MSISSEVGIDGWEIICWDKKIILNFIFSAVLESRDQLKTSVKKWMTMVKMIRGTQALSLYLFKWHLAFKWWVRKVLQVSESPEWRTDGWDLNCWDKKIILNFILSTVLELRVQHKTSVKTWISMLKVIRVTQTLCLLVFQWHLCLQMMIWCQMIFILQWIRYRWLGTYLLR